MVKTQEKYDQIIDQVNSKSSTDHFLTVYLPIKPLDKQAKIKKRIKQELKSAILKTFKNNPEISRRQQLPQKIVNLMKKRINSFDKIFSGVGLFCRFNKRKPEKLIISQFIKPPRKETFLGKTYDLDQLIWIRNTAAKAVIINIDQKKADVYILGNQQIKKVFHRENEYLETKIKNLKEYIEQRNLNTGGRIFYGSGTGTVENEKALANQLFLNEVIDFIQDEKHLKATFDHLVIFYTYPFNTLIDNLIEQSFIKTNFKPLLVTKNVQTKKEIKDLTIKNINQYQQKQRHEAFKTAKENHELFAKTWSEIIPAARKEKISVLFIPPVIKKDGYIDEKGKLWLKPKPKRRKVKNLSPWLVKSVTEKSGKIIVIKDNEYLDKFEVAAQLRY
jgi:hypothetical protein